MLRTNLRWIGIALVGVGSLSAAAQESSRSALPSASPYRAILKRYCITCHNEGFKTAGLMLDKMDLEKVNEGAEVWEKVIRKLRTGAMPPAGMPRPDKATYDSLATYLETALDRAAAAKPNPGRPVAHRLNRTEYTNAIRDFLGIGIEGDALLPADEMGYGFDNMADILSVSPVLMERYMLAADKISSLAVPDPAMPPVIGTYEIPQNFVQQDQVSDDLPFGSRGGIVIRHNLPIDGEYTIKVRLQRRSGGGPTPVIVGIDKLKQLDVRLDGERIKLFAVGHERKGKPENPGQLGQLEQQRKPDEPAADAGLEARFPAKAGTHLVGVTFIKDTTEPEGIVQDVLDGANHLARLGVVPADQQNDRNKFRANEGVASVVIEGPYEAKGAGETPNRSKIFVCRPTGARDEHLCAKEILSTLARRAYRRPVTDADVRPLLGLYEVGHTKGGFNAGIRMAVRGILVSPWFLYRIERDPANVAPDTAYRISDLELASRLSFFLWSSIPDEQLLDLAEKGKLREPEILEGQVLRMLDDPRSNSLVTNFADQWLNLRSLRSASADPATFPDFDTNLREALQRETDLWFESMLRENRSALDLLSADYTFVNERLARHYGIPNIYGSRFRRVTLTDENRWGLLGKGSVLMVTSYATRTAPTLRGKWVLENILGDPPPPPPPNVPSLKENEDTKALTMRQRMEQHRSNPACAGCHARMDPLGFALDNFNAIGKWRTVSEANTPIDTSGTLPDGTKFQGPVELRKILMNDSEQFCTTVTEKLLAYALGRGVEYYDEPAVREILRESAPSDYRWSTLILGVVKSRPFQMRRSREP